MRSIYRGSWKVTSSSSTMLSVHYLKLAHCTGRRVRLLHVLDASSRCTTRMSLYLFASAYLMNEWLRSTRYLKTTVSMTTITRRRLAKAGQTSRNVASLATQWLLRSSTVSQGRSTPCFGDSIVADVLVTSSVVTVTAKAKRTATLGCMHNALEQPKQLQPPTPASGVFHITIRSNDRQIFSNG